MHAHAPLISQSISGVCRWKCPLVPSVPISPSCQIGSMNSHGVPSPMLSLPWQPLLLIKILLKTYPHGHRPHLPAAHDYYAQDLLLSPRRRISRSVNLGQRKGGVKIYTSFYTPCNKTRSRELLTGITSRSCMYCVFMGQSP